MTDKQIAVIRPDDLGRVDDVAISCTMGRLERMSESTVWVGFYRGNQQVGFWIGADGPISVSLIGDDVGCVDDSARHPDVPPIVAENRRLRERLGALVEGKWAGFTGNGPELYCAYCLSLSEYGHHLPDCPVALGRKALEDGHAMD